MIVWQHHREHDHSGTETCDHVQITEAIGRYPAGTTVCDVLESFLARIALLEVDYIGGIHPISLDAFIAPYDPAGSLQGVTNLDAFIVVPTTGSFGIDAETVAPVLVEQAGSFGIGSYFVSLYNDAITVLTQPVGPSDTVIYVDSSAGFPSVPFVIQIGIETMTVTAVSGNQWTVIRGDPTLSHPAGSYVVVC
jgi:hypothetical protein